MATHEFRLPDVGEGVAEGEIVEWLVEPGDTVSEDQPVGEVETDKAVVEVPSPYNGTVKELHYEEGDMVEVGAVVVTFEVPDDADTDVEGGGETAGEAAGETEPEPGAEPDAGAGAGSDAGATAGETEEPAAASGRTFAPPSVRRLARELGVDLDAVSGSGPGGRVTEGDVQAAADDREDGEPAAEPERQDAGAETGEGGGAAAAASGGASAGVERSAGTGGAPAGVESADRERTLAVPATRKLAEDLDVDLDAVPATEQRDGEAFVSADAVREYAEAQQAAQAADAERVQAGGEAGPREEREPYRGIRRSIGQQMEKSKYTAPHVTHHDTVVVDDLVEWRGELKERAGEQGVKLTYMPFVMKAVVAALKEHPYLNSQLDEESEEIVKKNYYNVGVAVGTDAGLMVPVVDGVDDRGLLELASRMNELVSKAQERSIAREEMQGGTFTITNFGAIGGEYATPILNYPEVGILGLGAIEQRPVVEDTGTAEASRASGGAANGEVVARYTLPLSLSIDHRVVDGAVAADFVNTLKEYLHDPRLLLLE